jgi:hypothetical protein
MDEQRTVKDSIIEIFRRNGYQDVSRMTQRDFDHIGDELEKKSGITISGTTVKRLAYGEFTRLPQIATLNAVANYFGYKTWQDFKSTGIQEGSSSLNGPVKKKNATHQNHSRKYFYILAPIVVLASVYFFASPKRSIGNADTASFSFHKTTSNDIPNTVVFTYNIDDVQADSFFIQQSWDKNRAVRIYKGKYTLTDIYYEPGYHIAKLIANDSVIRTVEVSIPTDRWFFYAIDNVARYSTEYIRTSHYVNQGSLNLTESEVQHNKIDLSKDKRYHYVYFPTEMSVPSENFRLKTRVRMKEVRNSFCPYIEFEVYCQRYFMMMRSTTTGCAHEALLQFGENRMQGSDTDLVPITFDVKEWTDVEIAVENKQISIKINDQDVFSTQYRADTKNITGLGFISNGLCEVDEVELVGLDGKIVYKNEFESAF